MAEENAPTPDNSGPGFFSMGLRTHSILIVMFLIYMSDYADRFVVNGMFDQIKDYYNVQDTGSGALMSIVILFITIFTIPTSILVDRWSRRKMMSIMIMMWSLATLSCYFTKTYAQLMVARAFVGIGEAGYAPGGTAMIAAAYPDRHRGKAMGIWNIAIPLGAGIGLVAGEKIAASWGFKHAFGLVAIPGMLLAVAAWFLPDYKTVKVSEGGFGAAGIKDFAVKAARLFTIPSLVFTYLGFAMNVAVTTAMMTWLKYYIERTGLVEAGKGAGYAVGVMSLVLIGAPLGGTLSDIWRQHKIEARLYYPAISSVIAACLLFVTLLFPGHKYIQFPMLIVFGIFVSSFVAPAAAVTQDVVHPGLRALSYGLCVIVQHLLGDVWSPTAIGLISDHFGPQQNGLAKAFFLLPALGLMAGVFFFIASRFYVRDLGKVEKVELTME